MNKNTANFAPLTSQHILLWKDTINLVGGCVYISHGKYHHKSNVTQQEALKFSLILKQTAGQLVTELW